MPRKESRMHARLTRLAYRRAGSTTWVDIDPSTSAGQRLLSRFNSHPEKGITMTANAARLETQPRLKVVDPAARPGLLMRAKIAAQALTNRLANAARGAWSWIKRTFHLDAVTERVASGYQWMKTMAGRAMSYLGTGGGAGLGMLAISTDAGRRAIGFALKPVGWVLKLLGKGYVWLEETLDNGGKGGIRNWISNRMADAREFLFHTGGTTRRPIGIVPQAALWLARNLGGFFSINGLPMRATRSVGSVLFGMKMVALMALLPVGAFLLPLQIAGTAATVYSASSPFSGEISSTWNTVRKAVVGNAKAADKIVEGTATEIKKDVAVAAAIAGEAPNRESRRATKSASRSRGR